MSSFCKCKSYSHFFSKNISIYAIFNDQSFNDTLTNDVISFEQLGPGLPGKVKQNQEGPRMQGYNETKMEGRVEVGPTSRFLC